MARIKAVIFDMDGVLIDAKEWHYEALNRALASFGMEISRHEHLTTYDGLPTKTKLKMLSAERGLPVALHSFINEMKQVYTMELVYARCRPTFHHQFALSRLHARGLRLAVCSNSIRNTIAVMLERADLLHQLEFFLSNQDVQNPKPAPDIYLAAMKRLGLDADECLIVEDNPNGIKAAQDSGAHLLCVGDVRDVNLANITREIEQLENAYA
jgi:beta-phosphoglucomutase-like phosphatase (HAD superfamily)